MKRVPAPRLVALGCRRSMADFETSVRALREGARMTTGPDVSVAWAEACRSFGCQPVNRSGCADESRWAFVALAARCLRLPMARAVPQRGRPPQPRWSGQNGGHTSSACGATWALHMRQRYKETATSWTACPGSIAVVGLLGGDQRLGGVDLHSNWTAVLVDAVFCQSRRITSAS